LLGLGVGADLPVSLATIAEAATDKNRGKMLVFTQVMWIAASLTVVIITTATGGMGRMSGQILYSLIVVVALIGLALRLTVPESPLWLQSREERRRGIHTIRADKARVRDLLQPPFRRPFIVLSVFYALVLSATTVLGSFTTYVAVNVAGLEITEVVPFTILLFPLAFVALFLFMKYVDSRFRMPLFLIGGVVTIVGLLLPVFFGFTLVTILGALLIGSLGQTTCGEPIARVWGNEAFPTMLRSTAQGFVFTFGRLVAAATAAIIPAVIVFSPGLIYLVSAAAALLGVVVGWIGFRGGRIANEFHHEQETGPEFVSTSAAV